MAQQMMDSARWLKGHHPSELTTAEFLDLHCTGFIDPDVYKQHRSVDGFKWLGSPAQYPILAGHRLTAAGVVTFRQSGEPLCYVAHDADGEILRDSHGDALYISSEEAFVKGWPTHSQTIVAFRSATPVGFVANEWGAVGCWVLERFQRLGIGTWLVSEYLKRNPRSRLGQMTPAGKALARAVHRSFARDSVGTSLQAA